MKQHSLIEISTARKIGSFPDRKSCARLDHEPQDFDAAENMNGEEKKE
jgi:hypothetical protein